jgi:flagellar biosynthesis/type III secretory pathway chaperone
MPICSARDGVGVRQRSPDLNEIAEPILVRIEKCRKVNVRNEKCRNSFARIGEAKEFHLLEIII